MLNFLKNLLGKTKSENTPKTCCGGACSGKKTAALDLPEADKTALKQLVNEVVVGKIRSIRPHQSEKVTKVRVTTCDLGNGETEQILCGGANIAEGQIVPVAKIGADLGNGFVIGEREIRGEVSRGMICSRPELGLSEVETEKGGIWILPRELEEKLGTPINQL